MGQREEFLSGAFLSCKNKARSSHLSLPIFELLLSRREVAVKSCMGMCLAHTVGFLGFNLLLVLLRGPGPAAQTADMSEILLWASVLEAALTPLFPLFDRMETCPLSRR